MNTINGHNLENIYPSKKQSHAFGLSKKRFMILSGSQIISLSGPLVFWLEMLEIKKAL